MGQVTFECEFCYSANTSCQNLQSGSCITINESTTALPLLTEVTYCYLATAKINGNPVAVIQGNFSTGRIDCLNLLAQTDQVTLTATEQVISRVIPSKKENDFDRICGHIKYFPSYIKGRVAVKTSGSTMMRGAR